MSKLARSAIELLVKYQEQMKANALKLQELRTAIGAGAFSGRGVDSEDVFDCLNVSIGSNAAEEIPQESKFPARYRTLAPVAQLLVLWRRFRPKGYPDSTSCCGTTLSA